MEVFAMVKRFEREEIIARFKEEIGKGRPIFDSYAGTGISAKFADLAGVDMIMYIITNGPRSGE